MKIMEIVSGGDINGAIVHCALLCRELDRRGHQVTLVCRPHAWIAEKLADTGVQVVRSNLDRWPLDELRRVTSIVRERGIDVIHTHMSRANAFGVLLKMRSGAPCVATAHNRYIQLHWMFNDFVISTADATTKFHRRFNLVRKNRIETIHCFIDTAAVDGVPPGTRERLRASFGATDGDVLVGQIGDVIPRKGLLYLVRALPKILSAAPRVRLIVVGDVKNSADYLAQIKTEARELGVADAIHWAGYRRDIPDVLSSLDIVALASLEESLPLSILEAMASAKPVVATRVSGLPECVTPGETGYLVPPMEPAPLADAVVALAKNEAQRHAYGAAARRTIEAKFSLETSTSRIEALFARLASQRQRQAA